MTSEDINSYKANQHEVSIEDFDGNKLLVYKGSKVIPPHDQRKNILTTIHATHKSADATLRMARANFWFPHMSRDVKKMVDPCITCKEFKRVPRDKLLNEGMDS